MPEQYATPGGGQAQGCRTMLELSRGVRTWYSGIGERCVAGPGHPRLAAPSDRLPRERETRVMAGNRQQPASTESALRVKEAVVVPGQAFIGTSGWSYKHWKERFYPPEVPQRQWLEYFARHFSTVELNSTFYHQPRDTTYDGWRERTPDGFVFAVKMNRYVTHRRDLKDVEEPLERFLSGARRLKEKLGPILIQLRPGLHRDDDLLASFLKLLSSNRAWRELRCAFEFRHNSWLDDHVYRLLREAGCAICWQDLGSGGIEDVVTADFVYVRRHGAGDRYGGCYSEESLTEDADKLLQQMQAGRDVYAYFNNDLDGHALNNAHTLRELIEGRVSRSG